MKKNDRHICILGLGYIGLPTASIFATNGFKVTGVDVNASVVEVINRGDIHIEEPGLKTLVQAAIHSGQLRAANEPTNADVFIIAVPTPITTEHLADLSFVRAAAHAIVPYLKQGNLVVLESTSPPGTCRDVLAPIFTEAGYVLGEDLFLAHCPERVLPGQILRELIDNHRVIGGFTPNCAEEARTLYSSIVSGELHITSATVAEMVKVMENTFRDVNIALANELAIISERIGVDAWDVIKLANLHPRVNIHNPGPGVGGHCISVDPWFVVEQAPQDARIIHMARTINDSMPQFVAARILAGLRGIDRPKITILGVAYKGNVDDTRESPATEIIHLLTQAGVEVLIYDPHVFEYEYELDTLEFAFSDSSGVVLLAPHNEYKYLDPVALGSLMKRRWLLDTRQMLRHQQWENAGFTVERLGAASSLPSVARDRPM